jgi:hypothetical protein
MKLATQISDRAKRLRANRAKRLGARCECSTRSHGHGARCGSRANLGMGHRDGDESNGRPSNLFTVCKSCNAKQAVADKKAGRGVRTRQYNPKRKRNAGATNLAQYVQAAVDHTRGSHDAGGRIIHETPKSKRKEFAREIAWRKGYRNPVRRNPVTLRETDADNLYRKFHGAKPDNHLVFDVPLIDPYGAHPEIAQFGLLVRLVVGEGIEVEGNDNTDALTVRKLTPDAWNCEISFVPSLADYKRKVRDLRTQADTDQLKSWLRKNGTPDVAGEPGANQIYIVGGNQDISAKLGMLGADASKEMIDCGFCYLVEYFTQKRFDRMSPIDYYHSFGEVSGVQPRLMFWRKVPMLQLVGGEYTIKPSGINN